MDKRFTQDPLDREAGVEGACGILENDLDVLTHLPKNGMVMVDALILVENIAGCWSIKTHDTSCHRRLSRSTLTHDSDGLAGHEGKTDTADRMDGLCEQKISFYVEVFEKIPYFKNWGHEVPLSVYR
jgi:hypothetical protein